MSSQLEQIVLKMPHPIRDLAANYKSWQLNRLRRGGNEAKMLEQYGFERYFQQGWDELRREQARLLDQMIAHAQETVPFYQQSYNGFRFDPEKSLDQLQMLPLLSKAQAITAGDTMLDSKQNSNRHYVGHTSGSTGSPFEFHWSYPALQARYTMRDSFYRFHGIDFSQERNIRIGGRLFKDVNSSRPPFWIFDRVTNQLMFSIYHMSDNTMNTFIEPIRRFKPTFVTGYPSGIYLLARFCKESDFQFRPKVVFTDSETVLDYQRELIEEVWQCPVRDYLGMEAGWIAGQCHLGNYHISPLTGIVEIIDEQGQPQQPGEIGEIVMTDLVNNLMPLIRYRTGDTARWSHAECGCGWNTPILERIEGRIDDIVVLPNGRKIGRLDHIFKNATGIRECQIVQEKIDHFVFRLVPDDGYDDSIENSIIKEAHLRLGNDVTIDIQHVDTIERTSRGKFRSVISNVQGVT